MAAVHSGDSHIATERTELFLVEDFVFGIEAKDYAYRFAHFAELASEHVHRWNTYATADKQRCIACLAEVIAIAENGENIELSFKEFELLEYFMENQGIALSREKILNNVWNYDYFGEARTIDTHVKKLRSKMGAKGDYIKTIWGMGYKFEVEE